MSGTDQANIRGVAYTLDENKLLSAVRAAKDEARTRSTRYDSLCKEYTAEWWRRLWQGVRWTAALFVGVPLLTAVWGALVYHLANEPADNWWQFLLVIEVGALGLWTTVEVFARAAYGDDDAVGDTNPFSEAFQLWEAANVAIAFMPILATAVCFGRLIRTWRGVNLAEINEDVLEAYEWLMTPRLQMGQLLNEAIPTLNALAVIADTSPAVRRLVPPGYRFSNIEKCRSVRDGLWVVVDEMQAMLNEGKEPSGKVLEEWQRAVETMKKFPVIDDRRVAQIMLADIKEGK